MRSHSGKIKRPFCMFHTMKRMECSSIYKKGALILFNVKNYSLGFDICGLLLFLAVMLPNFVWFAVPAANDVLRNGSVTPHVDMIASVFQIVMVAALCIVINKHRRKPMAKAALRGIVILIVLYYLGWLLYYAGNISAVIIMDLCIAPCFTFVLFSFSRKNAAALISASAFMVCHVLYAVMNFVVQ